MELGSMRIGSLLVCLPKMLGVDGTRLSRWFRSVCLLHYPVCLWSVWYTLVFRALRETDYTNPAPAKKSQALRPCITRTGWHIGPGCSPSLGSKSHCIRLGRTDPPTIRSSDLIMAGGPGIEPGQPDPESGVLPLDDPPT